MNPAAIGRRRLPHFLIATFAPLLLLAFGAGQASVCDGFYSAGLELAQGKLNPPMVTRPKPAKGVATTEPNFKTCLFRATDHRTEPSTFYVRNDYSRRQAFNANDTYFITYTNDGSWHLYDANTLKHLREITSMAADAEPQWHPTDPNILYYLPTNGGTKLLKVDVRNNNSSTVVDFVGKLPSWASAARHIWTHSEGSPSANGRYWGFVVEGGNDWNLLGYMVWDLQQNRLVGSRQASGGVDNVSISASGRWFIASADNGVWAWSADFSEKKLIAANGGVHSDLGILANGNDFFISADYESDGGDVYFVDLDACPGVAASASSAPRCPRTVLFSMYPTGAWATLHFSAKSFSKPGWALISTYDTASNNGGVPWFDSKIFAIELKASPKIYPLAYTHRVATNQELGQTGADAYWTEPHATVNRDFTRISFNSNWGNSAGADVDVYTIVLPANALSGSVPPRIPVTGGILPPELETGTGASSSTSQPVPTSGKPMATGAGTVSIGCVVCARLGQARKAMAAFAGYLWHEAEPMLRSAVRSLDFSADEPAPAAESRAVVRKLRAAASAATSASLETGSEDADATSRVAASHASVVACHRDRIGAVATNRDPDKLSAANDDCGERNDRQRQIR